MKNALIIGHTGGIGHAFAENLAGKGYHVTGVSRSTDGLDMTDEASIHDAMEAVQGRYHLIFVATGALVIDGAQPEKAISQLSSSAALNQFSLNALGPALVLKHCKHILPRDEPAVFAALSARVGSISDNRLGGWYSYRASKAALNQLIHSAAIELARTHKKLACVTLHPGTVATRFTEKYQSNHPTISPQEAAQRLVHVVENVRAEDTGKFLDNRGQVIPW